MERRRYKMEEYLGKDIKKLGFGFMRLPDKPGTKDIDIEASKAMVDYYLKSGYTYFDTAVPYHGQKSESTLKICLTDRYPRDAYTIATKMTEGFLREDYSAEDMLRDSMKNIGVDYVDFYLLHALNRKRMKIFDEIGVWDFMKRMKAEGIIKHYGFSFHDKAEILEQALTEHPDVEFVQLQLNYADWENDMIQARQCYEIALKHNKPITIMEPVRGGMLATLPEQATEVFQKARPEDSLAKWALRFCGSLDNIICILSGMSSLEQVKENVDTFDHMEPLTESDRETLGEVVKILDSMPNIPCTECQYCVKDCPAQINIPRFFKIMNIHLRHDGEDAPVTNLRGFKFATNQGQSKPSACVGCKKCEVSCPQGIKIIEELVKVKNAYEPLLDLPPQ